MSPVAQVLYLKRENATLTDALRQATLQNFKLKQEVTGGLQIVWALANKQPDKKIVLNAVDLVTAMGSLRRSRDEEKDSYTFEALQPEEQDHEKLAETIVGKPPLGEIPERFIGIDVAHEEETTVADAIYDRTVADAASEAENQGRVIEPHPVGAQEE